MGAEHRQWRLLGQRYRSFEDRRLAGSIFRDRHGAFGWRLHWFEPSTGRTLSQYWCDEGSFFEIEELDYSSDPLAEGQWKPGNKLTELDPYIESCMREAMTIWEDEERRRESC
jgi:hypothetical protein